MCVPVSVLRFEIRLVFASESLFPRSCVGMLSVLYRHDVFYGVLIGILSVFYRYSEKEEEDREGGRKHDYCD